MTPHPSSVRAVNAISNRAAREPVRRALIVGGGVAGNSAAIAMRRAGIAVDLAERDDSWGMVGAGLTIAGPTLRAFQALGVLEEVQRLGHTHTNVTVCTTDGRPVGEVVTPLVAGPDVAGAGGIMRPVLHGILSSQTVALGTRVLLGANVTGIGQDDDGADVLFSDGTRTRYDVVVGADGIFSTVRKLVFPDAAAPAFTGQACWRTLLPRPSHVERRHFFLGGPVKVGVTPTSPTEMYMFVTEAAPDNPWHDPAELHIKLRGILAPYGGLIADIRDALSANSQIVYRPLEAILLPPPWFRGRTIVLGDAAHATTPQLASGAGMAVEDGLVLGEELGRHVLVQDAFEAFMQRRYERCRMVVTNSLEIGRLEMAGAPPAAQTEVITRSLQALTQPI